MIIFPNWTFPVINPVSRRKNESSRWDLLALPLFPPWGKPSRTWRNPLPSTNFTCGLCLSFIFFCSGSRHRSFYIDVWWLFWISSIADFVLWVFFLFFFSLFFLPLPPTIAHHFFPRASGHFLLEQPSYFP